jgi:hypothetical protein
VHSGQPSQHHHYHHLIHHHHHYHHYPLTSHLATHTHKLTSLQIHLATLSHSLTTLTTTMTTPRPLPLISPPPSVRDERVTHQTRTSRTQLAHKPCMVTHPVMVTVTSHPLSSMEWQQLISWGMGRIQRTEEHRYHHHQRLQQRPTHPSSHTPTTAHRMLQHTYLQELDLSIRLCSLYSDSLSSTELSDRE